MFVKYSNMLYIFYRFVYFCLLFQTHAYNLPSILDFMQYLLPTPHSHPLNTARLLEEGQQHHKPGMHNIKHCYCFCLVTTRWLNSLTFGGFTPITSTVFYWHVLFHCENLCFLFCHIFLYLYFSSYILFVCISH